MTVPPAHVPRPAAEPLPQAALATQLLSSLAADLPLRWIPSTPPTNTLPAPLTRALFSLLLRTASPSESLAAQKALLHAQTVPSPFALASLGFPSDAPATALHAVLHDLLLSAARGDALLLSGAALSLYTDAGPDADEFAAPTPDPRVLHAVPSRPLHAVRAASLARAIHVFAAAFHAPHVRDLLLEFARRDPRRFFSPLVDHLSDNVAALPNHIRAAVLSFYAAFTRVADTALRDDFATRLVDSLMRMASVDPSSISIYLHGLADARVRLAACRLCLVHRFGVRLDPSKSVTVTTLSRFLAIVPQRGRYNKAVPSLLTGLLMAWYEVAELPDVRFSEKREQRTARLLQRLATAKAKIGSFESAKRDIAAFRAAALAVGTWIVESNS